MSEQRRELDRAEWDWILYEDPDGALWLSVVVGWIGVFEHEHRLDEAQTERFRREGRDFLSTLSREINGQEIAAARARMQAQARR